MSNQHSRRASGLRVTALLTAAAFLAPVGLAAQQAQTPPPQAPAAPALTPQGPNLQLSMDEAVRMAMEANLGLKVQRMQVDIAAQSIAQARAAFLPVVSSGVSYNSTENQPQRNFDGTLVVSQSERISGSGNIQQQLPWYGASYSANWNGNRSYSGGAGGTYNPGLGSGLQLRFVQPLWNGLVIDPQRAGLESSQRLQVIEDLDLQQTIVTTEANVKNAYLDLVAARENLKVAQQNEQLEVNALANARARVNVGVSPQTDIIANEAAVARSRVQTIAAEARISAAEDNLRRLIFDSERQDFWDIAIVPTDQIQLQPVEIDLNRAIQNALANRIDLTIAKRNLELTDLNIKVGRNNVKPDLDFQLDYSASGTGGRATNIDELSRGFGSVLNDVFLFTYPAWTTSLNFRYPLGNSAAKAQLTSLQIQRQQSLVQVRDLELAVVQQVRDAARSVQNNFRQVEAARAALDASQRNLDAEQRRFEVGISTNLDLQVRQQQLADARTAELNAIIAYNRALILFQRVQRVR
ncbi:MAG TPA: TolC family protein [Vicinamibacterales bacterium]|nr:TolC family protein [Vicinamibacterales bacterium]